MQNKVAHRREMLEMITQWQQSGLSQTAFCKSNDIAYHVFHYWYGVYRSTQPDTGCFLPVTVTPLRSQELITVIGSNGLSVQVAITEQSVGFIKQLLLC
jgi:hypothetical protein